MFDTTAVTYTLEPNTPLVVADHRDRRFAVTRAVVRFTEFDELDTVTLYGSRGTGETEVACTTRNGCSVCDVCLVKEAAVNAANTFATEGAS